MSLRTRMISGISAVMLMIWALVTLNLMFDTYARHKAQLQDKADWLGRLLEAWVHEARDPAAGWHEFERRLTNSGLVDGWLIVGRGEGDLAILSAHPGATTIDPEDKPRLRAALEVRKVEVVGGPNRRRAYLPLSGAKGWDYAALLYVKSDISGPFDLTRSLWTIVAILFLGTIALVLLLYALMNRMVLAPLGAIVEASRRVSEGDYSRRIPEPARKDEVATMVTAFNSMMEKLDAYHQALKEDIRQAREKITNTERVLIHAQRLSTTGTLAAGIAHEINNPLGGMINAANALRSGQLDSAKQREYLDLIADGLARVRTIVQKVLHFRPQAIRAVPVALRDTVDRAIAYLEHKAKGRGVEVRNEVSADLEVVQGDPVELQQAVLNILMNAVDACPPEGGLIRVVHRREGDRILISIIDNGTGMDAEELARCLDPFYTTKDQGEGSGLGLPVASSIIGNHGGKLGIESAKGRGTTVTIDLPAASATAVPPPG
jgi:signal transduction histidine kinase